MENSKEVTILTGQVALLLAACKYALSNLNHRAEETKRKWSSWDQRTWELLDKTIKCVEGE
jgi:hypothetical protein